MNKEERTKTLINNVKLNINEQNVYEFGLCVEQWKQILDYIEELQQENKKYKEVFEKAIKCIDYNTKYRNGADIYQFVDIESEILEPLKFILELDEENGNAYLKEFNDWLKGVE